MHWLLALLLCWLGGSTAAAAAALDVQAAERISANAALTVCVADPSDTLALVQSMVDRGGCESPSQSRTTPAVGRGLDGHAFWVQLVLHNSAAQTAERWLQVGHPRLEEVSLLLSDGRRLEAGIATPMDHRAAVPRHYGVLPVVLAGGTSETVWLRVRSRTLVDVGVTVWTPDALMHSAGLTQLSLLLAMGALLAALIYAALGFVLTREWPYLFFCIAMAGEILLEAFRAGLLQHYAWPAAAPLMVELLAVGSLLSTAGFVAFFYAFVPGLRQQRQAFPVYVGLLGITLLAQVASIGWDYPAMAVRLWSLSVYGLLVVGIRMIWVAWRGGFRPAGTLLLGFSLLLVPEGLRLASTLGLLPFFRMELLSTAWAFVLVTPVLFAGLSQRSRELQLLLVAEHAENQAKLEFLTRMSHELRTPLDTILGNAQLLERNAQDARSAQGLHHIQRSGRHLLGMIDEVLDYSRGIAGRLLIHPEPVDWKEFVQSLEHSGRILAAQGSNAFALSSTGVTATTLLLDEHRLRQVLDNLLANAARHTHGGWLRVDCSLEADCLCFMVSDSGDGIAPQDLERIFLPFERGSLGAKGRGKGVGMGLTIARQLVQCMGGELTVRSAPGQGASFAFGVHTSPVATGQALVPEDDPSATGRLYPGPQRCVLVVDDSTDSQAILEALLQGCGFKVLLASSGRQAVEMLGGPTSVDLVLVDQRMDDGEGWMVLQAACALRPPLPAILVSSEPPRRPEQLDPRIRFVAEMLKPLDHAVLLQHLSTVFGMRWKPAPRAGTQADASPEVPQRQDLLCPPLADLQVLRAFIEAGQVSEILQWASALQTEQPACARFAQEVYVAARHLDFPALRALAG